MKRIISVLLLILFISCSIISCTQNGVPNDTTDLSDTTVPNDTLASDDTTVSNDTTVSDNTLADDETSSSATETTQAPETTEAENVEPAAPTEEYMNFVGSNNNSYLIVWPYSEDEFNVLASYGGAIETNLEGLANKIYRILKQSNAASFLAMSDRLYSPSSYKEEWCEILIGGTEREATKAVKAELAYNEYAIKVVGNDVVVTGLGYTTTRAAVERFAEILERFKDTSSGSVVYRIPANLSYIGKVAVHKDWILDIPEYTSGTLDSVTNGGEGSYIAVYNNTDLNGYIGYIASLQRAGYTKYFENNMAGNRYSVYTDGKAVINAYFLPHSQSAYLVVENAQNVTLPSLENEYTDLGYTSSLTQMKLNNVLNSNGQCHVWRLSDGRFIIVDGGGNDEKDGKDDAANLLELLYSLSGGKDPTIAAWFITHLHGDHYNVLLDFAESYTSSVTVENFIYNFPADEMSIDNPKTANEAVNAAMDKFVGAKKIKAHTGQKYSFANADIEMLYAPEMLCPNYITFYNDASIVFTVTVEGTKTLITADASPNTSAMMCDMYGKYLQCDILQISHHGSYGCSVDYYTYTNPTKLALLPVGATQSVRLTGEKENVFVAKLVEIVPHYVGTRTFYLPYKK